MRAMAIAQIVIGILVLPLGIVFIIISEGEARPFAAIFSLIWFAACMGIILIGVKTLKLIKQGKIQIAEIDDSPLDFHKSDAHLR